MRIKRLALERREPRPVVTMRGVSGEDFDIGEKLESAEDT